MSYDSGTLHQLIVRPLAALAVLLLTCSAAAETPAARWHAVAVPPRPSLPTVEVDLGYPSSYVPTVNSPIDLRAHASQPFDGYIGFHIAVEGKRTVDTPVIARAALGPGSVWTFSTWANLRNRWASGPERVRGYPRNREIAVEWRDRDLNIVAQQSIGAPPWSMTLRPLRVAGNSGSAPIVFGEPAMVVAAAALPDRAQWYRGSSMVVVPTGTWFELPARVRDAIFHSGTNVVFFGVPERVPTMTAIDRALLPVAFEAAPGTTEIPWPYSQNGESVGHAISWHATAAAQYSSRGDSPYIVSSAIATYVAGEAALAQPLPSLRRTAGLFNPAVARKQSGGRPEDVLVSFAPLVAAGVMLAVSIVCWLLVKNQPRAALLAGTVALAIIALGARNAIRPEAGKHVSEDWNVVAPGVANLSRAFNDYGAIPRPGPALDSESARLSVTRSVGIEDAEIRASETPPGFGTMVMMDRAWDSTARVQESRELATPAVVHVVDVQRDAVTLDFDSAEPLDIIAADWIASGRSWQGEVALPHLRKGRITVHAGTYVRFRENLERWGSWNEMLSYGRLPAGVVAVTLERTTRDRVVITSVAARTPQLTGLPLSLSTRLIRGAAADAWSGNIVVPELPPSFELSLGFSGLGEGVAAVSTSSEIVLAGQRGTAVVPRDASAGAQRAYVIDGAELKRIAPPETIVNVSVRPTKDVPAEVPVSVLLWLREKKR